MVAHSGVGWKLAAALIQLEDQVNKTFPGRSKESDGSIGDLAHSTRPSDHNVKNGFCHALDITHDPKYGFDSYKFADMMLAKQDPRLSYIISNRRIGSGPAGPQPGKWRKYTGTNAHDHHVHFSVNALGETNARPWDIGGIVVKPQSNHPVVRPTLRNGSVGVAVKELQTLLGLHEVDAIFGRVTEAAVKTKQTSLGLVSDGIVGPATWEKLSG